MHIWVGISRRGKTAIVIFEGRLTAKGFRRIARIGLITFLSNFYPDSHRVYMDNDPKHNSKLVKRYFRLMGTNIMKTPAQSPVKLIN